MLVITRLIVLSDAPNKVRISRFKAVAALVLASLVLGQIQAAIADQARAFKDSTGTVFIYGLSPNETFQVGFNTPVKRRIIANSCGLVIVRNSSRYPIGSISIDGVAILPQTLPINTLPRCQNGTLEVQRIAPFKTARNAIAIPGKSPNQVYGVVYPEQVGMRPRKANACGFLVVRDDVLASQLSLPTIGGAIATFNLSALPVSNPLRCFKGQLYLPQGWSSPVAFSVGTGGNVSSDSGTNDDPPSSSTGGSPSVPWGTTHTRYKAGNSIVIHALSPNAMHEWLNVDTDESKQLTTNACGWGSFVAPDGWGYGVLYRDGTTEVADFDLSSLPTAPSDYFPTCP